MPTSSQPMAASSASEKTKPKGLTTRPSLQKIPMQSNFNAIAGSGPWSACLVGFHDDSYYEDWKKKREEAVARGEDPNARFLALVAAKKERSTSTKLKRLFSKEKQYTRAASVIRLDPEEEDEARRRDAARGSV
ncbi:hypothetical protein MMC24_001709 [Lignoscripta atroalba]|nr:hypothetical protein [Lignoscripta atroalba]